MGVRTEMKNLNSFKAIGRAVEYETARQIEILEKGGRVIQKTRRWDDDKGESYGMRFKENAQDYRYFPEPDLLPISIDDAWLEHIKEKLPELAHQKRERYVRDYGLSESEAVVITNHKKLSGLYENISEHSGKPMESAHLVSGEIMRLINHTNTLPEELSLDGRKLAILVSLVSGGKINRNSYKEAVEAVFTSDVEPLAYIAQNGLMMQNDDGVVAEAVDKVLSGNPGIVADYRAGKDKTFGFFFWHVMKNLGGSGNPELVRKALKDMLDTNLHSIEC
jgi:aspartyl-tRNA(Asn)/glutamyl-tRNA(Gln) amidotransferase subunit B